MIDAHHHFWKYSPSDFPWIDGEGMEELKHDHTLAELEYALEFSGINQVISVQARRTDHENRFLLRQAKQSGGLVAGVIGWAPLDSPDLRVFLDQYLHEPLLIGIREMIANTPEDRYLNNPDFDEGIRELTRRGLTFDLCISHTQLPAAIAFADRHPDQRMVLNHCGCTGLPPQTSTTTWARNIRELARRPHTYCKLTGLTDLAPPNNPGTTTLRAALRPYFDTLLHAFGPARLMFGSNWPVCNLTTTYPAWLNTVDDLILTLSDEEKNAIYRQTAINFYRLHQMRHHSA